MSVMAAAIRLSEEAGGHEGQVSPYVFGVFTFAVLCVLLIVTMMVNVDR